MQVKDTYTWKVQYMDGTCTHEFDEARPDGRGFAEREEKPVQAITLAWDELNAHRVQLPEGAEPVFFRRRSIVLNPEESTQRANTVHCIGWKTEHSAVYLFAFDDGSVLLTDNLQAV